MAVLLKRSHGAVDAWDEHEHFPWNGGGYIKHSLVKKLRHIAKRKSEQAWKKEIR